MMSAKSVQLSRRLIRLGNSTHFAPRLSRVGRSALSGWTNPRVGRTTPRQQVFHIPRRHLHVEADSELPPTKVNPAFLPVSCPGCGALTQWVYPEEAGFYSLHRKPVKEYIRHLTPAAEGAKTSSEDAPVESEPQQDSHPNSDGSAKKEPQIPFCDRCHNLVNHGEATPIPYPPLSYFRDLIADSPHKQNHIYHILDAADFPMSLIPEIYREIGIQKQRSKNRRASTEEYKRGARLPQLSFIITRADLLAPEEELTNKSMHCITTVLRNALGRSGSRVRLGNVHLVSAHRGWWTKEIKEMIRKRGGAVWMVGKTNVGKSSLMSTIFPKSPKLLDNQVGAASSETKATKTEDPLDENTLLPPPVQTTGYPVFPIVSSRPGTTASPIRIPFENGEVIDLPGLARNSLQDYVADDQKDDLIMKKRIKPDRHTIKPGKSLILGGLIRITSLNEELVILASPFVPMTSHLTSDDKAELMHTQQRQLPVPSMAKDGIGDSIASAGIFELKTDLTSTYARSELEKFGKENVPYKVLATDILIEGCGWVELIAQVRKKQLEDGVVPKVEVFSPEGKFIGSRAAMGAWEFILAKRKKDRKKLKRRPMRSKRRS